MKQLNYSIFSLLLLLLCFRSLPAQVQENRVALVVGNSHYKHSPLANPGNDARDMANVLRRAGFTVTEKYDLNVLELNNAVTDFTQTFTGANTVALFYYAGHGIGSREDGKNYLIPIEDDDIKSEKINYQCVPLDRISAKMKLANNYINIIILDACRKYSFADTRDTGEGGLLPFNENLSESLVAYATQPGNTASDQQNSANGLYTGKILKNITTPGLEIKELFFEVGKEVKEQSGGQQIPNMVTNLTQKFYFFGEPQAVPPVVPPLDSDRDGVFDDMDRCPNEPGPPANNGCPVILDPIKPASHWQNLIGISYSWFGAKNGHSYERLGYNAFQAYYALINKVGGYISAGGFTGSFDISSAKNLSIPTAFIGAVGPGVQWLNTSRQWQGYVLAGIMVFQVNKREEVFSDGVFGNTGYQALLVFNHGNRGFEAGYVKGFENTKGFTLGVHYSF